MLFSELSSDVEAVSTPFFSTAIVLTKAVWRQTAKSPATYRRKLTSVAMADVIRNLSRRGGCEHDVSICDNRENCNKRSGKAFQPFSPTPLSHHFFSTKCDNG